MGKSIGIDLGTTNSVVAFKDTYVRVLPSVEDNQVLYRSCVAYDKSGHLIVGNAPYRQWRRYSPNIVVSVKRLMGTAISDPHVQKMKRDHDSYPYGIQKLTGGTEDSVAVVLSGREYTPEQISSEILKRLKEDASKKLNDEVTHAVITVPAYFSEKQKAATRKAAQLAGLTVQRLLAEPTAAAISYGADQLKDGESKVFLVYDFGGGTFDLSILVAADGKFIESGTGGDRWLGGDDIDRILKQYVYEQVEKEQGVSISEAIDNLTERDKAAFLGEMKTAIEDAKKALSVNESATVGVYDFLETPDGNSIDIEVTVTRAEYERLIRPLVQRSIELIDELLEKTNFPIETIDNILLVGGSSCIPLVKKMLSEKYGAEKVLSSEKPMLAIAEGAAILAHSLPAEAEVAMDDAPAVAANPDDEIFTPTTKHNYYIEVEDASGNVRYESIIDNNDVLPLEKNKKFFTTSDKQKVVEVKLFSDAENETKEKLTTGFFTISEDLPKGSGLMFTFSLDIDEVMNIKVRVESSGHAQNIVLARGAFDQACLNELSDSIKAVMSNGGIENEQKLAFMQSIQKSVEKVNAKKLDSMDNEWKEIKSGIENAKGECKPRNDKEVFIVISKILTDVFKQYINPDDANQMNSLRSDYEVKKNDKTLDILENLCNRYGLLIDIYLYGMLGNNASDPAVAQKAQRLFKGMMADLSKNDVPSIRSTMDENDDWLHRELAKSNGGGVTYVPGTALGI